MEANAQKFSGVYEACLGMLKGCLGVVIVGLKYSLQQKRNVPNLHTLKLSSNIPPIHNTNQPTADVNLPLH